MSEQRKKALRYLKTVRGQMDGIISMIEEDRYCLDISNQILASLALLKKANAEILSGHLHSCVLSAGKNEEQLEKKLIEIEQILNKLSK